MFTDELAASLAKNLLFVKQVTKKISQKGLRK